MRRHVKAASAASSMRQVDGLGGAVRGAFARRESALGAKGTSAPIFGLTLISLLVFSLLLAPSAGAATVTQRPLLFTIDGADVPDRPMIGGHKVAVDNATGAVYFSERTGKGGEGRIFRYHADGTLWPFASSGLPYLAPAGGSGLIQAGVAVDNSGGANQSRLYVASESTLKAFDPSGELLWNLNLPSSAVDVAVDANGSPYVAHPFGPVRRYANTGSPPVELSSFSVSSLAGIDVNAASEIFLSRSSTDSVEKWVGGSFSSTLDSHAKDVYLDQSSPTGSIFTPYQGRDEFQSFTVSATAGQFRLSFEGAQTTDLPFDAGDSQIDAALEALPTIGAENVSVATSLSGSKEILFRAGLLQQTNVGQVICENGTTPLSGGAGCSSTTTAEGAPSDVQEYGADGTLLGTFGQGALVDARSVAYNPGLDRLYAMQSFESGQRVPSVVALGPVTTGTVADVTIETPSAIGVATAHLSGTVNPQGTTSEWRFQWRASSESSVESWATATSSPPQSLPADSSDHTVEYTADTLSGGTTYQVRLVAVNTANQLLGASEPKIFTTTKAAQAPAVTIEAPSAITDDGATIGGTVNPQGDTADWRVQTSTDPACATGFTDQPLQEVSPSSNSPVNVSYAVTGLLPSQRYCARIVATNSAGSTTSGVKEFETLEAQPSQVFAAYAAPRTDTTARLNGYVNPEGSMVTYRFEYSADGSSWTALPDQQTGEERRQIVVASELSGLQPATTYHYRFTVENDVGPVQSDEKTFETRTTQEMQLPQRGIELVNKPEKGNQNIPPETSSKIPFVSEDGNRAVWKVLAGAPGGTTGTEVNFLAVRTDSGWQSQPLAPPAAQQVGGGEYAYKLNLATPDLRTFLMRASQNLELVETPPTFVQTDDQGQQDVLKAFPTAPVGETFENADMTYDGEHVIIANPETGQLEEIGPEPHEVVSIMPDGQPAECGVRPGDFYGPGEGSSADDHFHFPDYHRMAITDASRLYFQAQPNGGICVEGVGYRPATYYRDRNTGQTIEIDPATAPGPSRLIRATPDGRSVVFTTQTSHSPADENPGDDIYRWDSDGGEYTCLSCVVDDASVSGRVMASDDLSQVYFTSQRQLVPGHGMAGELSVYSLGEGELNYVAPGSVLALFRALVSSDGNVLVFRSNHDTYSRLTADEQADQCKRFLFDLKEPNCQALFRYEDSTNSLECLSCLPGGVTTRDVGELNAAAALSEDGSTVAFVTHERLLAEDINNAEDVYEWRNGALQLITDGETAYTSTGFGTTPRAYGIDADGKNIFFTVVQSGLTGYEQDGFSNLYDARVGGGFPRPTETPRCSEESCQGPLAAPPPVQPSGSSGLNGAGNEVTAAKKRGRCAAKRGKARQRCLQAKRRKQKRQAAKRRSTQRSDRGTK